METKMIYGKIPTIMDKIGAIGKGRQNKVQGYNFRGIDDVYAAVNSVLAEQGVFCVPEVLEMHREERTTKNGGMLLYTILKVKYDFFAEDGSFISCTMMGEAMDSGDKSCNKAMSAAQKYAFLQIFCIPTEEPKDTENESHEVKPKVISPPQTSLEPEKKGKNFKFLEIMQGQKKRIGDTAYYAVLGLHGFEKSSEIIEKETQTKVYYAMLEKENMK